MINERGLIDKFCISRRMNCVKVKSFAVYIMSKRFIRKDLSKLKKYVNARGLPVLIIRRNRFHSSQRAT